MSNSSDIEVLEDGEIAEPGADPEDEGQSDNNPAPSDTAMDSAEWPATDDDADENGNLKGFIDDDAEESEGNGEEAGEDEDGNGQEQDEGEDDGDGQQGGDDEEQGEDGGEDDDEDEGGENMDVDGGDEQYEGEPENDEREPRCVVKSLTCIKNSYYYSLKPPS